MTIQEKQPHGNTNMPTNTETAAGRAGASPSGNTLDVSDETMASEHEGGVRPVNSTVITNMETSPTTDPGGANPAGRANRPINITPSPTTMVTTWICQSCKTTFASKYSLCRHFKRYPWHAAATMETSLATIDPAGDNPTGRANDVAAVIVSKNNVLDRPVKKVKTQHETAAVEVEVAPRTKDINITTVIASALAEMQAICDIPLPVLNESSKESVPRVVSRLTKHLQKHPPLAMAKFRFSCTIKDIYPMEVLLMFGADAATIWRVHNMNPAVLLHNFSSHMYHHMCNNLRIPYEVIGLVAQIRPDLLRIPNRDGAVPIHALFYGPRLPRTRYCSAGIQTILTMIRLYPESLIKSFPRRASIFNTVFYSPRFTVSDRNAILQYTPRMG